MILAKHNFLFKIFRDQKARNHLKVSMYIKYCYKLYTKIIGKGAIESDSTYILKHVDNSLVIILLAGEDYVACSIRGETI